VGEEVPCCRQFFYLFARHLGGQSANLVPESGTKSGATPVITGTSVSEEMTNSRVSRTAADDARKQHKYIGIYHKLHIMLTNSREPPMCKVTFQGLGPGRAAMTRATKNRLKQQTPGQRIPD
jgi:hypothetical protein